MRAIHLAITTLMLWTIGIEAFYGVDYHAKAAYFNFVNDGVDDYVFALNVNALGDVYFHMSGPVTHSWIGVGFGSEMKNSFMLLAYPSADGHKVIISPRIATGHTEPAYDSSFEILKIQNDTYGPNANIVTEHGRGTIISHAVCFNCSRWATGFLDTESTTQPFIFALGPNTKFRSDSLEASVPRHSLFGRFTMDMTQATNYSGWYGRVPAPNIPSFTFPPNDTAFASANSEPAFDVETMSNPLPGVHAALMCVAFALVFPSGAMIMQFLKRTLTHAMVQVLGFILVFAGFGVAASFAGQYNKSKNYSSAHQVIGIIILAGLAIQLGLGLVHHSVYLRSKKPTPFGRIHFFLGPFIIILGLINGGIGFGFAGNETLKVPYAVVVVVLVAIALGVFGILAFCRSQRKFKPEPQSEIPHPFAKAGDSDFEMREASLGERPPEPYDPTTPYSPSVPEPYSPTVPYTPMSAHMPMTPNTWRKEDINKWPSAPYRGYK